MACISTYNVQTYFELVVVQLKILLPSQSIPFKPHLSRHRLMAHHLSNLSHYFVYVNCKLNNLQALQTTLVKFKFS